MTTWAIIPVKQLSKAKSSLKPTLTPEQRHDLVLYMLEDVLSTIKNAPPIKGTIVVSLDQQALDFACSKGATPLTEPGVGLNKALNLAINRARELGAKSALILPSDLPLLRPVDIEKIVGMASGERDMVITPSKRKGTNALLLRPPDLIDLRFGGESFQAHLEEARRTGIMPHVYRSERVETDIDEVSDLIKLKAQGLGTRSHDFLRVLEQD
ncbi:MAG: 2-phospho-L-lactate guanylyltransferase [Candidatus Hadarchaeota archaeon]|nr:2-phospho-L-lactate guanylyltransferase [Candidatus Hadarchaeota archaeon]